jgi:hypothetical protein
MPEQVPDPADCTAIYSLVVRYARALDTRDYELLETCFTDSAIARYITPGMDSDITFDNPRELAMGLRRIHSTLDTTLHRVSNHTIVSDGDHGHGRPYVDVLEVSGGDTPETLQQIGYYDDEYVRVGGEWKFASRIYHGVHTSGNKRLVELPG